MTARFQLKNGWWNLNPFWDYLTWAAAKREGVEVNGQKKKFWGSSRYYNPDAHLIGIAGEFIFSLESGLPFDIFLSAKGDGGVDFAGSIQIKTSTFQPDPCLKESQNPKCWADYYGLVYFNPERKLGKYLGWTTGSHLASQPLVSYSNHEKAHPCHSLSWRELWQELPEANRAGTKIQSYAI